MGYLAFNTEKTGYSDFNVEAYCDACGATAEGFQEWAENDRAFDKAVTNWYTLHPECPECGCAD